MADIGNAKPAWPCLRQWMLSGYNSDGVSGGALADKGDRDEHR
jgi:hypothetical protein